MIDRRLWERWKSLQPDESNRSLKSVIVRWNKILSKFKLFLVIFTANDHRRYINDFNNHKIPGSTGRPRWWDLTADERTEHSQGKKKLKVLSASIWLILDPTYKKDV
jgi:hypothetical protein